MFQREPGSLEQWPGGQESGQVGQALLAGCLLQYMTPVRGRSEKTGSVGTASSCRMVVILPTNGNKGAYLIFWDRLF